MLFQVKFSLCLVITSVARVVNPFVLRLHVLFEVELAPRAIVAPVAGVVDAFVRRLHVLFEVELSARPVAAVITGKQDTIVFIVVPDFYVGGGRWPRRVKTGRSTLHVCCWQG